MIFSIVEFDVLPTYVASILHLVHLVVVSWLCLTPSMLFDLDVMSNFVFAKFDGM